jgi:hypothetical protein
VSVESIEQEYEYIRYGGRWLDFVDNLKVIQKLDHRISFNMLHFLLNYQSIFECVDYLTDMGFHNNSFVIGALLEPDYLNIRNLPDNMLNLVKDELLSRINKQPGFLLEDGYCNVLDYISQPYEKQLLNSFNKLKEMDLRRNVDSSKIFKELYKEKYYGKTV